MARQTAISTADDMRWLREVHLPRLPAKYKSAIIVGNEDYPDRIEVYERRDPRVTDVPVVFTADEEGVFKETSKARQHATKKPRKKGTIEVMGGYKVDLDRGGQLIRERIDVTTPGDYGADPLGPDEDGVFRWRMVPSGAIVDRAERTRRLDDYAKRSHRSHSTVAKKSPAQLQREIDEALSRRKPRRFAPGDPNNDDYLRFLDDVNDPPRTDLIRAHKDDRIREMDKPAARATTGKKASHATRGTREALLQKHRAWSPAVRGRGEVTSYQGGRAFVEPVGNEWLWEVELPRQETRGGVTRTAETVEFSGAARTKAQAKRAALEALYSGKPPW